MLSYLLRLGHNVTKGGYSLKNRPEIQELGRKHSWYKNGDCDAEIFRRKASLNMLYKYFELAVQELVNDNEDLVFQVKSITSPTEDVDDTSLDATATVVTIDEDLISMGSSYWRKRKNYHEKS